MANEHNQLIGFKVYDAQRSIYKSLETALAPLGITPGQFAAWYDGDELVGSGVIEA